MKKTGYLVHLTVTNDFGPIMVEVRGAVGFTIRDGVVFFHNDKSGLTTNAIKAFPLSSMAYWEVME